MSSKFHKAFHKPAKNDAPRSKKRPEGLKVKRAERSSFDTPLMSFMKRFFAVAIAAGAIMAIVLFVRSFTRETDRIQQAQPKEGEAYQKIRVNIGYKPEQP